MVRFIAPETLSAASKAILKAASEEPAQQPGTERFLATDRDEKGFAAAVRLPTIDGTPPSALIGVAERTSIGYRIMELQTAVRLATTGQTVASGSCWFEDDEGYTWHWAFGEAPPGSESIQVKVGDSQRTIVLSGSGYFIGLLRGNSGRESVAAWAVAGDRRTQLL